MEIINWLRESAGKLYHTIVMCKADSNYLGEKIFRDLVWDSDLFGVQSTVDNDEEHEAMVKHIVATADLQKQYDTIIEKKWSVDWSGWSNIDSYFDPSESSVSRSIINEPELTFDEFRQIFEAVIEDDDYQPFVVIRFQRQDGRVYTYFVDREADVRGGYYVETAENSPVKIRELVDFFE